jgi:hypothetical protein
MNILGQNDPTPSEIRSAHKKAVGGKRDRCSKGKSCSAACIQRSDRCLVDFPIPASRATTKLRDKVTQLELFPTEKFIDRKYVKELREFKKRIERGIIKAIHLEDEDKYNRHRDDIIEHNRKVGLPSSSAIKVPATWDRLQNVKGSYEKAKAKILVRLEKAAKDGDRRRYDTEEARLLKIRRILGVKVGDTGKYERGDTWYRLGGGLQELKNLQRSKAVLDKSPRGVAKEAYENSLRGMYLAARNNNREMYDVFVGRVQKLRERVKAEGIPYKVGSTPSWDKVTGAIKGYEKEFSTILKKVEKAAAQGDMRTANKGVEALYKLHVSKGDKIGMSFPLEKVEFARRGGKVPAPRTSAIPYPLRNADEFRNVERWTGTISRDFHAKFAKILRVKDYYGSEERDKIMSRLGVNESTFAKAVGLIKRYTGTYYELIKDARDAVAAGKPLSADMKRAIAAGNTLNRFIAAFPKEEIPKFRGGRVSSDTLRDLIESSRMKGEFNNKNLITSWSSDLGVAKRFADRPPGAIGSKPERVIMQTINKMGIGIESITQVPNEMELLTSGLARYRHTGNYHKVEYNGETYHIFEVVEY